MVRTDLEIVGAEHDDDEVERLVALQAWLEIGAAVLETVDHEKVVEVPVNDGGSRYIGQVGGLHGESADAQSQIAASLTDVTSCQPITAAV